MDPMTGVNSPFTQDELDQAVARITAAGISREWAEDYLAKCWIGVGTPPRVAAEAVWRAMRAKWPGELATT
jgi:two-component SAPR family response regulator